MSKMGRPPSDEPRRKFVGCKLTDKELQNLEDYCNKNKITKSDAIKSGIESIINPKSESE